MIKPETARFNRDTKKESSYCMLGKEVRSTVVAAWVQCWAARGETVTPVQHRQG